MEEKEGAMKRILIAALLLMRVSAGYAIPGDLNLDGVVDFSDFFIFSDNFGQEGPPDTLRVTVHDTLKVTVLDTLELETVYDTVTVRDTIAVEFVPPPETIPPESITNPDLFIATDDGEPLHHITLAPWAGSLMIRTFFREPIDSDDYPILLVNYNRIPVPISITLRYVPLLIDDQLNTVSTDTFFVHRAIMVPDVNHYWVSADYDIDDLRYPDIADTRGSLIVDVVYRTPLQGDFAARAIVPASVSENGKISG